MSINLILILIIGQRGRGLAGSLVHHLLNLKKEKVYLPYYCEFSVERKQERKQQAKEKKNHGSVGCK